MTAYYIDPERCFEVPFRIPLPDKDEMERRLANIRLIMKNARERQSHSNAEHRRTLFARPTKYRDKAKAIMKCGRLKRFVGDLTERYFDYLDFHQENPSDMSPLIIPVPVLCPPLSPPDPNLFGPPRQGDLNEIMRSNLSWSQFAAPVPAGWRERFLHDRQWEHGVERRAWNEYSDKERRAEYASLESQRRDLEAFLQEESNSPPPLQRKRPVPLPPFNPSPLVLGASAIEESAHRNYESRAACYPPSRKIFVRQQLPESHLKQRPALSCQSSRRRPSLRVTIPGTECFRHWLNGRRCDSPLSGTDLDAPLPSVLLNADAVRAHLDSVHGPHNVFPRPESPRQVCSQSPPRKLIPSKLVIETSPERIPARDTGHQNSRKSLFTMVSAVQPSEPNMAPPPSTPPKLHIHQPRPIYPRKRRASQGSSNDSLKKQRLVTPT